MVPTRIRERTRKGKGKGIPDRVGGRGRGEAASFVRWDQSSVEYREGGGGRKIARVEIFDGLEDTCQPRYSRSLQPAEGNC